MRNVPWQISWNVPPLLWTKATRQWAVEDTAHLINVYNRVNRHWAAWMNINEDPAYDINRGAPAPTAAEMQAFQKLQGAMTKMEPLLLSMVDQLKAAAREAVNRGLLRPEQLANTGLAAIQVIIIAFIAAIVAGLLGIGFFVAYRQTAAEASIAEANESLVAGFNERAMAHLKSTGQAPTLPPLAQPPPGAIATTAKAVSNLALLAAVGVAAYMLFSGGRRRAA